MKYRVILAFLFFITTLSLQAQADEEIPDIASDVAENTLEAKVYRFMAEQTEKEFVERHLNVNDSIEFPIHFEVDATGKVIAGKTKVITQYDFFNNYFELIVNRLPALNVQNLKFDGMAQFAVTSESKLTSLFKKEDVKPKLNTYKIQAVYPGCDVRASNKELQTCFDKKISAHVLKHMYIKKGNPLGRMIVSFVIDEYGMAKNIKIIRDVGYGTGPELARAMALLPQMQPAVDAEGKPVSSTYTLPITILAN